MQTFELKFSGVTILQGVKFPVFLLILSWALQQCSATALPVILHSTYFRHHALVGASVVGPADILSLLSASTLVLVAVCVHKSMGSSTQKIAVVDFSKHV